MNVSELFDLRVLFRVSLTAYCALMIYNFISAVFGLCLLRRVYIGLLRRLYRVRNLIKDIRGAVKMVEY